MDPVISLLQIELIQLIVTRVRSGIRTQAEVMEVAVVAYDRRRLFALASDLLHYVFIAVELIISENEGGVVKRRHRCIGPVVLLFYVFHLDR